MTKQLISLLAALSVFAASNAQKTDYTPQINGTIRAKYEYQPETSSGRFEVRNARVSVTGKVAPIVNYKAEIDLSDEGSIKMLDAYARLNPVDKLNFTIGQMRVPFTIDAHRSPHQQYFANRSFIAKQVGNVRDVGATIGWQSPWKIPVTIEGGLFNGSGLTAQKNFWTKSLNYSVKASALFDKSINLTLSCQKIKPGQVDIYMWDAGIYYHSNKWHVEAEYLRKNYANKSFNAVDAIDAFACYDIPMRRILSRISILGRYDYMSDHSNGIADDSGELVTDDPARHRVTGGVTLGVGKLPFQMDIRINYEAYFYKKNVTPAISEQDKIVVEFMCRF